MPRVDWAPADARVDAIMVPIHREMKDRRVGHLRFAVGLARRVRAHLVVVCSPPAYRDEVLRELSGVNPSDVTLVDLPVPVRPEPMLFRTSDVPGRADCAPRDVGRKRNLGLMLARMLGWRQILFLDDDVHGLPAADLMKAASALATGPRVAVGWASTRSPDNSVVCHAHRLSGGTQGVFIGGGALLVDVDRVTTFFPDVYNEDWLFLADPLCSRAVGYAGTVRQRPSPLFEDPLKAACQEFGDVLGEGLLHLLGERSDFGVATGAEYWDGVLDARRRFLLRVDAELRACRAARPWRRATASKVAKARACVLAALAEHRADWATLLARYVRDWEDDKRDWACRLRELPRVPRVAQALQHLELQHLAMYGDIEICAGAVGPRIPVGRPVGVST